MIQDSPVSEHFKLRISHVLLSDGNTESWSSIKSPVARDELELGLDVLSEECQVVRKVELGGGEDQGEAEDGPARHPPHLACP